MVMGAATGRRILAAGLLDELHLHLVPLVLGAGTRLFDGAGLDQIGVEPVSAVPSAAVTHLVYRVRT